MYHVPVCIIIQYVYDNTWARAAAPSPLLGAVKCPLGAHIQNLDELFYDRFRSGIGL